MSEAIDVVLPVHNEAESIGGTLREFYQIVTVENISRSGSWFARMAHGIVRVEVLTELAGGSPAASL